jgi:hypothetical protein
VSCKDSTGHIVSDAYCSRHYNGTVMTSVSKPPVWTSCGVCDLCMPNWVTDSSQLARLRLCSGHGTCANGVCVCDAGWSGTVCNGTVACPSGRWSVAGQCCSRHMDARGQCCMDGDVLDKDGACCSSGRLSPCGTCSNQSPGAVTTDASGQCCAGVLDAGGMCCPFPSVLDACGVCNGVNSCVGRFQIVTKSLEGYTPSQLQV